MSREECEDSDREDAKAGLRAEYLARRRRAFGEECERAGAVIARILLETPELCAAGRVGLFAARDGEVPTRRIFDELISRNQEILFPRVTGPGRIVLHRVRAWEDLRPGAWGILEPPESLPTAALGRGDAMLVPGVVFDRAGYRIGMGGGYYDRLLDSEARGSWSVGLAFAWQVIERVPVLPHDRRLDAVVCESGLMRFDAGG